MVSKCCRAGLVLVLGLFFHLTPGAAHAALPNGSIAVLVKSASPQEAAQTASVFTRQLLAKGYKVVDPKKLEAIRRSKAAALALDGNVDAIMKLGRQYGFSTMITAQVEAGSPVLNEFQLYTGTSSVAVMVTASNGSQIYADTVAGKQVGYTPSEAKQKSLEAAAALAVKRMTE
ncbi:hypothetical protein [uncultured Fretibacterium sp.]|uniref:hypothetical protein n=1 Tax=uncultured Fretibacterium sp. TaxID=1678694 RepID=UPI00325FCD7C